MRLPSQYWKGWAGVRAVCFLAWEVAPARAQLFPRGPRGSGPGGGLAEQCVGQVLRVAVQPLSAGGVCKHWATGVLDVSWPGICLWGWVAPGPAWTGRWLQRSPSGGTTLHALEPLTCSRAANPGFLPSLSLCPF